MTLEIEKEKGEERRENFLFFSVLPSPFDLFKVAVVD